MMNKRKILSKIKYPKFLVLILAFAAAYLLFSSRNFLPFQDILFSLGYIGTFFAGFFFTYGFTAAPATAILLILAKEQNIILAGFIGGFGALVGDLLIFKFVRHSFAEEIEKIRKERIFRDIKSKIPFFIRRYLFPVFAGFIIASPLPDEIGVSLLSATTRIQTKIFSILSYILNTAGIFVVLTIGNLI